MPLCGGRPREHRPGPACPPKWACDTPEHGSTCPSTWCIFELIRAGPATRGRCLSQAQTAFLQVSVRVSLHLSTAFGWGLVIDRLSLKGDPPGPVHACHPHSWLAPGVRGVTYISLFRGLAGGRRVWGRLDAGRGARSRSCSSWTTGGSEAPRRGQGEAFPPSTC